MSSPLHFHPAFYSPPRILSQPRCNRETIENELLNLRSNRSGFVKTESLRYSNSRTDDDKDEDQNMNERSRGRKWWRRPRNGGREKSWLEKVQEASRKAKVMELRLIGRRSWWPKFDGKSRKAAAVLPLPSPSTPDPVEASKVDRGTESEDKSTEESPPLVTVPTKQPFDIVLQLMHKFDKCETPDSAQTRHKKNPFIFWKPKDVDAPSLTTSDDASTTTESADHQPPNHHEQELDETEIDEKKKKKNVGKVIAAAIASVATTSLGVVAIIIIL